MTRQHGNTVDITTGTVTSQDGTTIGYRQLGRGPGLVMLHGSMESSSSHLQLAQELADVATVYLPDRRGRGLSGPYRRGRRAGRGGAGRPGVAGRNRRPAPVRRQLGRGDLPADRADHPRRRQGRGLRAGDDRRQLDLHANRSPASTGKWRRAGCRRRWSPECWRRRWDRPSSGSSRARCWKSSPPMAMDSEDKKASAGDVTMRMLAPEPALRLPDRRRDRREADDFAGMSAQVLLLGGSKSPAYLRTALDALEKVLPHAERHEFAGLDHGASG